MALADYNGWSGSLREKRNNVYYPALKSGAIKVGKECVGCGYSGSFMPLSPHAEDYGSTPEHYIECCLTLCVRCHGLIHIRFSYQDVWAKYIRQLAEGRQPREFPSMPALYDYVFKTKKKGAAEDPTIPKLGTWLDTLSPERYAGPPKIATVSDIFGEVPDPSCYGPSVTTVTGLVVGRDGSQLRSFVREGSGWAEVEPVTP